jgi:hypothetical protein
MLKKRLASLVLAVGSFVGLAAPTPALALDWNDRWRISQEERRLAERERRLREQRQRLERERYLREQALRERFRSSPYRSSPNHGYYDRYGIWHR